MPITFGERMKMTDTFVIVNLTSAGGTTHKRWPQIEAGLRQQGLRFRSALTEGPGHAIELARQAAEGGADLVISVGGEGTLNETVNGLMGTTGEIPPHIEIGIIPSGTGNDFVRTLGIPRDPLDACRYLACAGSRVVDLGEISFQAEGHPMLRYFVNVAGLGFDSEVVDRVNRSSKALGGTIPYLRGLAVTALTYRNPYLHLELDGQVIEGRSKSIVVCNGRYFGGGMFVAPDAEVDDGVLNVVHFGDITNLEFLLQSPKVYKGTHVDHPLVETYRAHQIRIESERATLVQADGDVVGQTPATFRVLPRALRVRAAPANSTATTG